MSDLDSHHITPHISSDQIRSLISAPSPRSLCCCDALPGLGSLRPFPCAFVSFVTAARVRRQPRLSLWCAQAQCRTGSPQTRARLRRPLHADLVDSSSSCSPLTLPNSNVSSVRCHRHHHLPSPYPCASSPCTTFKTKRIE